MISEVPPSPATAVRPQLVQSLVGSPIMDKAETGGGDNRRSVSIVYTMIGDVCLYIVGKDEYDELALSEVIFAITSAVKDVCVKPPRRLFWTSTEDACLDEIV
ncbi:hypothetical protein ZWY2020_012504 [Hordeum vulgare]|nr:hypothetical protein ZWY2020_012504 [Hordeum vulgare]